MWIDDIVKVVPKDEDVTGEAAASLAVDLARGAGSYDEYTPLCAIHGVEPIFTRAEFET